MKYFLSWKTLITIKAVEILCTKLLLLVALKVLRRRGVRFNQVDLTKSELPRNYINEDYHNLE